MVNAALAGLLGAAAFGLVHSYAPASREWLLLACGLAVLLVIAARFTASRLLVVLRQRGYYRTATLIVGTNEESRALAEQLLDAGSGLDVVGFVDPALGVGTPVIAGIDVVASLDSLSETLQRLQIREVIVAPTALTRIQLLTLYQTVQQQPGVQLRLSSGLFEILTTTVQVHEIGRVSLMTPRRQRITGFDAVIKATIDYVVAACALLVFSPLLLIIALLVWIESPGPIIHRRRVIGISGHFFDAFKFRSMVVNAERRQRSQSIDFLDRRQPFKSKRDPRITRVGRILRRTSLDELPQLANVLRGEMSLVGPRMIAPDEARRYGKYQVNLVTVKPGITGPWQVRGRGDIPYEERVRLSMHYIRNYSIWLDLEILIKTVFVVLKGGGAY